MDGGYSFLAEFGINALLILFQLANLAVLYLALNALVIQPVIARRGAQKTAAKVERGAAPPAGMTPLNPAQVLAADLD
jgi:hypothetical protein